MNQDQHIVLLSDSDNMPDKSTRIAVLIDADNVSDKYIAHIFDELSKYGTPTYKRIYGDWTGPQMGSWKKVLLDYSITPIQQYSYTTGKNATDSALIIDAMDILYTRNVDCFCIVSSDSDFTRLAARLREAGTSVIGMGERKTPKPFISACEVFKYLDVLAQEPPAEAKSGHPAVSKQGITSEQEIKKTVQSIVAEISDDEGWAFLGVVGNLLGKRYPDFDTRNYGQAKLTGFIKMLGGFEITQRNTANPTIKHTYIRLKDNGK